MAGGRYSERKKRSKEIGTTFPRGTMPQLVKQVYATCISSITRYSVVELVVSHVPRQMARESLHFPFLSLSLPLPWLFPLLSCVEHGRVCHGNGEIRASQ